MTPTERARLTLEATNCMQAMDAWQTLAVIGIALTVIGSLIYADGHDADVAALFTLPGLGVFAFGCIKYKRAQWRCERINAKLSDR